MNWNVIFLKIESMLWPAQEIIDVSRVLTDQALSRDVEDKEREALDL